VRCFWALSLATVATAEVLAAFVIELILILGIETSLAHF
jgi:hypothetical protein